MPKFNVRVQRGFSTSNGNGQTQFVGSPAFDTVEAENRAEAYIQTYRKHAEQGEDVTVIPHVDGQEHPLNFTREELETLHSADVPMKFGTPENGVQIEQIVAAA